MFQRQHQDAFEPPYIHQLEAERSRAGGIQSLRGVALRQAQRLGPNVGGFAERLLAGPFPWSKLRQGQKLLRLAERYTAERLDAACARALGFDLVDVRRLERILVLALEHEGQLAPPVDHRLQPLPAGRFARPGRAFDHRFTSVVEEPPS